MTRPGIESVVVDESELIVGRTLGLVTNPSGVTKDLTPTIDLLYDNDRWTLTHLFAPQHGVRGNSSTDFHSDETRDEKTGLPVDNINEAPVNRLVNTIEPLDVLVYDMQDIGCRFYTYAHTLFRALECAAAADTTLLVLDRPNPIAPIEATGNVVVPVETNDQPIHELPIVHGFTVGELARYFNQEHNLGADVEVVAVDGWNRDCWFDDMDLPWVQPSPNMPTVLTATLYPGTCFFEGTNISEGRGTTKPFELIGAPWVDADEWVDRLNECGLDGVGFRPAYFTPMFSKHERKGIEGVQIHVLDRDAMNPVEVGLTMLISAFKTYPDCEWMTYNGGYFVDRLAGGSYLRKTIDNAKDDVVPTEMVESIRGYWADDLARFSERRKRYTIY